jgi:hypothetical protein
MQRPLSCFCLAALCAIPLSISAQVLAGKVRVNGSEISQQRLTLSCPFFDLDKGWHKTNVLWTLHLIDAKKVSGEVALDVYGRYNFNSNKWFGIESVDENRIVLWEPLKPEFIREYVADGRTRGGYYVKKGERAGLQTEYCASIVVYIDRNTLKLTWESSGEIPAPVVEGGQLKKCEGVDAWPRGETVVSSQCEIVPYRAPPNRIGF